MFNGGRGVKQQENYWTYRASELTPEHTDVFPHIFSGTEQQWYQLSPGMRREIYRQAKRACQVSA